MIETSIVSDKLKTFDYYKQKLPMYLRNSYGFQSHFRLWYDLYVGDSNTKGIVPASDTILNLLNIFDEGYLEFISALEGAGSVSTYGENCDTLDKIGELFGVHRNFTCSWTESGTAYSEELSLNNEDFLILIKAQIINNFCEGTFEQIKGYYESAKLYVFTYTPAQTAVCKNILADIVGRSSYSNNVKKMFKAGMLRISSMGVKYEDSVMTVDSYLRWDNEIGASISGWDLGVWTA